MCPAWNARRERVSCTDQGYGSKYTEMSGFTTRGALLTRVISKPLATTAGRSISATRPSPAIRPPASD